MRHRIVKKISDNYPYEIVKIELLADNKQEKDIIMSLSQQVIDYLTLIEAVDILEDSAPQFVIKKAKSEIGFGQ